MNMGYNDQLTGTSLRLLLTLTFDTPQKTFRR